MRKIRLPTWSARASQAGRSSGEHSSHFGGLGEATIFGLLAAEHITARATASAFA